MIKINKKNINLPTVYKLALVLILCVMIKIDEKNQVEYIKMLTGTVTAFVIDAGKSHVKKKKKKPDSPDEKKG